MKTLGEFLDGGIVLTPRDFDWMDEAAAWNFMAPPQAAAGWRIWGIRHIRSIWKRLVAYMFWSPRQGGWHELWYQEWVAYGIWRGWY